VYHRPDDGRGGGGGAGAVAIPVHLPTEPPVPMLFGLDQGQHHEIKLNEALDKLKKNQLQVGNLIKFNLGTEEVPNTNFPAQLAQAQTPPNTGGASSSTKRKDDTPAPSLKKPSLRVMPKASPAPIPTIQPEPAPIITPAPIVPEAITEPTVAPKPTKRKDDTPAPKAKGKAKAEPSKPQKRDFPNLTPEQQKVFDQIYKDITAPTPKKKAKAGPVLTDLGKAVLTEVDKVNQTNPKAKAKPLAIEDKKEEKSAKEKALERVAKRKESTSKSHPPIALEDKKRKKDPKAEEFLQARKKSKPLAIEDKKPDPIGRFLDSVKKSKKAGKEYELTDKGKAALKELAKPSEKSKPLAIEDKKASTSTKVISTKFQKSTSAANVSMNRKDYANKPLQWLRDFLHKHGKHIPVEKLRGKGGWGVSDLRNMTYTMLGI